MPDAEEKRAPRPGLSPRRLLAFGGAGLTALGLGLLLIDVLAAQTRLAGWLALVGGSLGLLVAAWWSAADDAADGIELPPEPVASAGEGYRDVVHAKPPGRGVPRWVIAAGALLIIALQALIPLRYYLGDDAYDERFAWRMFSDVRMYSCELGAAEGSAGAMRPVALTQIVHEGWITTFRRNRRASIDRYLAWRCEENGLERARLTNSCRTASGVAVPPIVYEIDCASGEITREGGAL